MRYRRPLLFALFCLFFSGCVNGIRQNHETQQQKQPNKELTSESIIVTGLVCQGDSGQISIVENNKSKSRKSYFILNQDVVSVSDFIGKYVVIKGFIMEKKSPWRIELNAIEIQKVSNKPINSKKIKPMD